MVIATVVDADNSISLTEFYQAFFAYAEEGAKRLNLKYKYVLLLMLQNVVIFMPTLVIGLFVLRKKRWARNIMIGLLVVLAFYPLVVGAFTSELNVKILNFDELVRSHAA